VCVCVYGGGWCMEAGCLSAKLRISPCPPTHPPWSHPASAGPFRISLSPHTRPSHFPSPTQPLRPSLPPSLPFLPLFRSPHTPTADFTITPGYLLNLTKNGLNPLQAFRDAMNTKGTEGRDGGREGRRKGGRG